MNLKEKIVLVTGSSRGIGKSIAVSFGKEGCKIILNASKSKEELQKTVKELREKKINCHGILTDVSDYHNCKKMFSEIIETYGTPDIVVNNAGISHIGLFSDMTPKQWKYIMDINFQSVLNCTHLALPSMIHKKEGLFINISSMWGEKGASCEAVYSASKGAVNAFTKSMAKELGPSGIRVNAISCGVIDTAMNGDFNDEEQVVLKERIALLRFGKTKEVAQLAVFLASEKAEYITGQIITIDGCMD